MSHEPGQAVEMADNNKEIPAYDKEFGRDTVQNSRSASPDEILASATNIPPQTPPARTITGMSWGIVVAAVLSSTFLFAIDNTITADIQPAIVHQFNDTGKLSWISVAFLLTSAAMNLPWGRCYGHFEAKWLYILCIVIFEVGSALCAAAPSMEILIVGRAICGIGGVGMYIGVMTLLSALTTIAERPVYLALTGAVWGLGTVCGPFVGGGFADSSATWRWGFYINLCIGGLFSPVYLFILPRVDPRPGATFAQRIVEIDWVGATLLAGTLVSTIMAISFGGVVYEWNGKETIPLFVVGGVLFIMTIIQQIFAIGTTKERRIFPVQFLKSKEMVILFIETACGGTSIFVPIYFIPLLYQLVKGDSALKAGLRLLPYIMLLITFVMINGWGMGKFGYYMPWFTFGSILVITGSALLYTIDPSTSDSAIYGYTVLIGIGAGSFSQAPFSVAQALIAPEVLSQAISFISSAQIGGATIGLTIANAVFLNTAQNDIAKALPGVDLKYIQGLIAGVGGSFFDSLPQSVQIQVVADIVSSFNKAIVIAMVAGALALVLSLFMRRNKLDLSGVPQV
ncbi:hypothetical protein HYFRA_00010832 [Hymenoscyphus fraxineus]|uniref:Major facilitator superfamily (MFS) profile domain-containing protein n=1 Tax=Hymenoscyphus fraxineus TaxID=746836 RepID=A0A9N9PNS4_9HELO|nr:hypothetical protein HYFRA_00010832 [Hymenoscyphus fraxineus]